MAFGLLVVPARDPVQDCSQYILLMLFLTLSVCVPLLLLRDTLFDLAHPKFERLRPCDALLFVLHIGRSKLIVYPQ